MLIINFKNYVHGKNSLKLAQRIERYLPQAFVAVPPFDLDKIASETKLKVYAQHVDYVIHPERSTGFISAGAVYDSGAKGSLLNHSEHQISLPQINDTIRDMRAYGLESVVCVPTLEEVRRLLKLENKPYALAFEDANLIATGKSIITYKSENVKQFVQLMQGSSILPLCGAGISSAEDVREAIGLGCKGVLIASAIANTKEPEQLLCELNKLMSSQNSN